jgi:hypothetical protein
MTRKPGCWEAAAIQALNICVSIEAVEVPPLPDKSEDHSNHMTTMSVNEGVDTDGACVDSSLEEYNGGTPRHSSCFAAVPHLLLCNASMQGVADNRLILAHPLKRREVVWPSSYHA